MAVCAVHFNFVEERKGHVVFGRAKLFDVRVRAGFLATELVAGKTKDDETLVLVFFINCFEIFILWCKTAFGGNIYNEHNLAFVGGERGVLAVNVLDGDVIDGTGVEHCGHKK